MIESQRIKKSVRNIAFGSITFIILIFLKFLVKIVLVRTLGDEYLGLNGLFQNIVAVFSIAELGLGIAVTSLLYKPLVNDDKETIKKIVSFCKRMYYVIGFIIIACGAIFLPFLGLVTKDTNIPSYEMQILFGLYVLYASLSYFNYHKITLLLADQKSYIEKLYVSIFSILSTAIGIITIFLFNNYYGYMGILVVSTILQNVFISLKANKLYPYLKDKSIQKFSKEEKKQLKKNVFAVSVQKFSSVFITSTDSLIISSFIGLAILGLYSNYSLIFSSISGICWQIKQGLIASIGNAWKSSEKEAVHAVYMRISYLFCFIYIFCATALFCLSEPFIALVFGNEYVMSKSLLIVMTALFFVEGLQHPVNAFKETQGLFVKDKYVMLSRAVLNIGLSILFVNLLGIEGVILATIVSFFLTTFWSEPIVLFKYGFERKCLRYFLVYFLKILLFVVICLLTYFLCSLVTGGILGLIIKMLICIVVPSILFVLSTFWMEEMKYYAKLAKRMFVKTKER